MHAQLKEFDFLDEASAEAAARDAVYELYHHLESGETVWNAVAEVVKSNPQGLQDIEAAIMFGEWDRNAMRYTAESEPF